MAGIVIGQIKQVSVGLADADGVFTIGTWVSSPDNDDAVEYIEGEYNIASITAPSPLHKLLEDSGYDTSSLP